jgi:hypothetical protein
MIGKQTRQHDGEDAMIGFRLGVRICGALILALAAAQCGDGGGGDNGSDAGSPPPGTFTGTLADGGTITLEVGSIEAIAFTCDDQRIQESFAPPRPVDENRRFAVEFTDAGRKFQVRGAFENDDLVQGTIDDQANECDTTFTAHRGDPPPTRTTTPSGGVTPPTPTLTPTPVGSGPTDTPTTTPTPICADCTPTTPPPTPCPVAVEVVGNAANKKVLDSGWTGLAHNATVVSDGKLTFDVQCSGTTRPCGVCDVSGPIQNLKADHGDINAHRCSNNPAIKCTDDSACTSPGVCAFFFGAPLPLSAGGINTCVTNQVNGAASGTVNVESGQFASTINLTSRVFTGDPSGAPCPTCDGDGASNDGAAGGTCTGGTRSGQACDVNGTSPIPAFGTTSLDCPPVAVISALQIALDGSSGTETRTLGASSPNCTGVVGADPPPKCFCPAAGTEPTKPSACIDDSTTDGIVEACEPVSAGSNRGQCTFAPVSGFCSPTETFRECRNNGECPQSGDTCVPAQRPCYLDNGAVGGSVTAKGVADAPDTSGVSNPTFAALFCIPPVAQAAINTAGGLPGLGRIELPLVSKEIYALP